VGQMIAGFVWRGINMSHSTGGSSRLLGTLLRNDCVCVCVCLKPSGVPGYILVLACTVSLRDNTGHLTR